ncbi:MAG: hypothetical protein COB12_05605 [Flavobacterium sp.]|nr:MAG: hypothetical protein COB12_05605 [Flavobacterium sp.]
MLHKISFIFLLFIVTISCKKEASITLTSENFSDEFQGDCKGDDCAKVTIDYIKIQGEKESVNKINFTIGSSIIYFLNSDLEKNIRATTISEAANSFLKAYEIDKKEFPDLSPYTAEVSVSNSYSSSDIISIKTSFYNYTGGAHGNTALAYLNFNPTTGAILTKNSLLKNKKEFISFAEKIFRKEKNIAENDNINSTGFWFENDSFSLPESIGFSKTHLILIYNQYEIASYADGPIEVLIPIEEVKPFLNF